tara:strand:- start:287 stop:757 length:471 start_codon:yes stop_codon:yes gene_type:complete
VLRQFATVCNNTNTLTNPEGKRKMLERDILNLRQAIEALTAAIKDSQALLVSAALDFASKSEEEALAQHMEDSQPPIEAVEPTPADLPPSIDPVDDPAPTLSDEQVKDLLLQMSRAGKSRDMKAKLAEFGVGLFSALKGDDRQVFVDWLVDLAERA